MLTSIKPGQTIRVTVTKPIHVEDDLQTVMRLMRQDTDVKRGLKSAQEKRVQRLVVRSRGKRPWESREKSSKLLKPAKGSTWKMRYFPHIEGDFKSVAKYLSIEAA